MERWNELVAGYVLGNLTEEESQELEKMLADEPQLHQEIVRLRKTATMRDSSLNRQISSESKQPLSQYPPTQYPPTQYPPRGSEGWSDGDSLLLESDLLKVNRLLTPPTDSLSPALEEDYEALAPPETAHLPQRLGGLRGLFRAAMGHPLGNPWWWILVLALIGVGIDDWRVRRSLAIAQEKIVQMEQKRISPFPQ